MMRRYSRPRHFTAGCTRPRRFFATNWIGFTTMPSPPESVSSSHHAIPFVAHLVSQINYLVWSRQKNPGIAFAQASQHSHMPHVIFVCVHHAFAREQVKGSKLQICQ